MAASRQPAIGFLTVVDLAPEGLVGGYLLLNSSGRPLEFHCTAPVRPNRAQEILYGATLTPYLYGEQIGRTLVEKSGITPLAICTDHPATLALADFCEVPLVLLAVAETDATTPGSESARYRVDGPHAGVPPLRYLEVAGRQLAVPARSQEELPAELTDLAGSTGLDEPFQRIREAIEEAQRGAR